MFHLYIVAVPGAPHNVRAAEVSPPNDNICIILVQWDPPTNTDQSNIDRYIVYVPSRDIMDIESSAISVLRIPNCREGNVGIQVAAVNHIGCLGQNSSEIQPSLSFDIVQTTTQVTEDTHRSTTIIPIESTSTSSKY